MKGKVREKKRGRKWVWLKGKTLRQAQGNWIDRRRDRQKERQVGRQAYIWDGWLNRKIDEWMYLWIDR